MTGNKTKQTVWTGWDRTSVYASGGGGGNIAIFMQETRTARLKGNSTDLRVQRRIQGKEINKMAALK